MTELNGKDRLNLAIGAFLRRTRKQHRVTQVALSADLGLEQSALSRVETGQQALTAAQWFLFCARMNVTGDMTAELLEVAAGGLNERA